VNKVLRINPKDNIIVALTDLFKNEVIIHENETFVILNDVHAKHKFAMLDFQPEDEIIMYGVLVGRATKVIKRGEGITTENIHHASNENYKKQKEYIWTPPDVSKWAGRTFNGYLRSDGRAGTANYWLFIPTVFCENRNLDYIKDALLNQLGYAPSHKYRKVVSRLISAIKEHKDTNELPSEILLGEQELEVKDRLFPNVDGIKFLTHTGGCGGTRQDSEVLGKLLASYADHPNVAGVTVLSLGCQHLQKDVFVQQIKDRNPSFDKPLYIFEQQQLGSEEFMIAEAIKKTFAGLAEANKISRTALPLRREMWWQRWILGDIRECCGRPLRRPCCCDRRTSAAGRIS
jgi:altronate hydrolase